MTTFTASEVRELANNFAGYSVTHHDIGHRLLDVAYDYANRLEADEKAVPVVWINPDDLHNQNFVGINAVKVGHEDLGKHYTLPLYTHPSPADAERLAEALEQAMQSLRTIERGAMREEGLEDAGNVRAYARSRAGVAENALAVHAAQAQPQTDGLHPATTELVDRFADALREKLLWAQLKYGYSDNWQRSDWMAECRQHLREHLEKGDPLDVAAYCAFLWHHGASTTTRTLTQLRADCEAQPPTASVTDTLAVFEVVSGVEGPCLTISRKADGKPRHEYRLAGPKPWGGGNTTHSFKVHTRELREQIDAIEAALAAQENPNG